MHSKSDSTEIMMNDEADKIMEELFDSLKNNLKLMKGSDFVFNYVHYCIINIKKKKKSELLRIIYRFF